MGKGNTCNTFITFQKGMSLIEILVVVGIFAVLGVVTTRAVLLTIGGGKKTETVIKVRENLNYALGVMERQLRNADSVSPTNCTGLASSQIIYVDEYGGPASFSCQNIGSGGYVASGSANPVKLTSDTVSVIACSFVCSTATTGTPSSIKITLQAQDSAATGVSNTIVDSGTEVFLRNYK